MTPLERAIYDTLYDMRLAPTHQLEQAAKRIAALTQLPIRSILALDRFSPTMQEADAAQKAQMELDNALGQYVRLHEVELLATPRVEPLVLGINGLPRLPTPATGERVYTGHGNYDETPLYTEEQVVQVQQETYDFFLSQLAK